MNYKIKRRIGEPVAVADELQTVTLNVIGKIKIGEKRKTDAGKEYPASLDYFRPDTQPQYEQLFFDAYGQKPNKLTILFLSNEIGDVCRNFYELRNNAGKVAAYGDGVTFNVTTNQGDGAIKYVETTPDDPEKWMNEQERTAGGKWRETLILRFALPEIPVLGLWEFRTHGQNSTIKNIVGAIEAVKQLANRIALIPFDLTVQKVTGDKAGSKNNYPVVGLVANISAANMEKIAALPQSLNFILTEQRISTLAANVAEPEPEPEFAESFELSSTPNVEPGNSQNELSKWYENIRQHCGGLVTIQNFNDAVAMIVEIRKGNEPLAKDLAEKLADEAQQRGWMFDKKTNSYQ